MIGVVFRNSDLTLLGGSTVSRDRLDLGWSARTVRTTADAGALIERYFDLCCTHPTLHKRSDPSLRSRADAPARVRRALARDGDRVG